MGRIQEHNREMVFSAEHRAGEMRVWPSPLEEKMLDFLKDNHVEFEFQKIFYIHDDDGWIRRYYIADFYIPDAGIIIETDGKFHDLQAQHDKNRTKEILEQYFDVAKVIRWRWEDFKSESKMENLLYELTGY